MTNKETNFSANITLVGYRDANVREFCTKFEQLQSTIKAENLGGDIVYNLSLKDMEYTVQSNRELPEALLQELLPMTEWEDPNNELLVRYEHTDSRLVVTSTSQNGVKAMMTLAKLVVEEQSNTLKALGYNFERKWSPKPNRVLSDSLKTSVLNLSSMQGINSIATLYSFSYSKDDFTKRFNLIDEHDTFKVTANYHYTKFQKTLSTSRIRRFIVDAIEASFEQQLSDFLSITNEVCG